MTGRVPAGGNVYANGIRQHYLRFPGDAGTVALIPGITSPAATWAFVARGIASAGFDVIVIDVRGRGLSESGPGLDYGLDSMAADLNGLVQALGLRNFALMGHSMGARIAGRAAARGLKGLERLVLVDPPVSGPGRRAYPGQLPWYVDSIRAATRGMDAGAMQAFCPTWTEEQRAIRAEWLHTCYEPAVVQAHAGFHEDDFHADLPGITVPTLLMVAGRGDVIRPEDEDEIRELLPSVQVARVAGAGHMIPWDDLDGFYAAFGDFLGRTLAVRTAA